MIQWIDSGQALHDIFQALSAPLASPFVAIDTEFVRRSQFFAAPGLLQIGWQTLDQRCQIRLVDLVALAAVQIRQFMQSLYQLCHERQLTLVMHAPAEDLQLFDLFEIPRDLPPLLDTQIAAAYLDLPPQLSLNRLASTLLATEVDLASQAQSNWLERPLTWTQMHYAAQDVNVLLVIAPLIKQRLETSQLYQMALEDCRCLFQTWPNRDASQPYAASQLEMSRIAGNLRPRLAHLMHWRESAVRFLDIPRKWHLSDDALVALAHLGELQAPPKLQSIVQRLFNQASSKRHSLNLHQKAKEHFLQSLEFADLEQDFYQAWGELPAFPKALVPIRLGKQAKKPLALLERKAVEVSMQRSIPAQAFYKRSWLKLLMQDYARTRAGLSVQPPCIFSGWRAFFIEEAQPILDQSWPFALPVRD